MNVTINTQTIITAAALLAAVLALIKYFANAVRWKDRQDKQDSEIANIRKEQTILCYGVLACLKGLKEQGCNGPVTNAIEDLEKHLNISAHT